MASTEIRFDDGAGYERYMGSWSRHVGERVLDWLELPPGLTWLDVGCGGGAFSSLILQRCAPGVVFGIDPSEEQLAHAGGRSDLREVRLCRGDAVALPFRDDTIDVTVMPLVIFFVPEPLAGVVEMARVVRPGGVAAAYAWDMPGGGFPYAALQAEIRALGVDVPSAPRPDASGIEALRALWTAAGFADVRTTAIEVTRTFADLDDYWTTVLGGPSVSRQLSSMSVEDRRVLLARMRECLQPDAAGRITCCARANAVKGRRPE